MTKHAFIYYQTHTAGIMTARARELVEPLCPCGLSQVISTGKINAGTFAVHAGDLATHLLCYDETTQVWDEHPDCSGLFVGYWKHLKPTPQDLEKPHKLKTVPAMIDGEIWNIPVILNVFGECVLPQRQVFLATEDAFIPVPEILEEYRDTVAQLRAFYDNVIRPIATGEKPCGETAAKFIDVIVGILSLCYYVDKGIINLLRLVRDDNDAGSIIIGIALGYNDLVQGEITNPVIEV